MLPENPCALRLPPPHLRLFAAPRVLPFQNVVGLELCTCRLSVSVSIPTGTQGSSASLPGSSCPSVLANAPLSDVPRSVYPSPAGGWPGCVLPWAAVDRAAPISHPRAGFCVDVVSSSFG